jgi:hydrogenase expression/formation protein HypC
MLGIVDVCGVRREIHLACIVDDEHPIESCVGDWVLVHVGFATSRIDEAEAAKLWPCSPNSAPSKTNSRAAHE